jgi:hypothetical protein
VSPASREAGFDPVGHVRTVVGEFDEQVLQYLSIRVGDQFRNRWSITHALWLTDARQQHSNPVFADTAVVVRDTEQSVRATPVSSNSMVTV